MRGPSSLSGQALNSQPLLHRVQTFSLSALNIDQLLVLMTREKNQETGAGQKQGGRCRSEAAGHRDFTLPENMQHLSCLLLVQEAWFELILVGGGTTLHTWDRK